jgi:hypothetical protein
VLRINNPTFKGLSYLSPEAPIFDTILFRINFQSRLTSRRALTGESSLLPKTPFTTVCSPQGEMHVLLHSTIIQVSKIKRVEQT